MKVYRLDIRSVYSTCYNFYVLIEAETEGEACQTFDNDPESHAFNDVHEVDREMDHHEIAWVEEHHTSKEGLK